MSSARYSRLDDDFEQRHGKSKIQVARDSLIKLGILLVIIVIAALWHDKFWIRRSLVNPSLHNNIHLDDIESTFTFNSTFGEPPSAESDAAWDEIFPKQGGYFKHPTLAPERSALSVFHLLHCLNGIRQGYWIVYDAAVAGNKLDPDSIPFMASPRHIQHCIDLLRNSLMCYPDTTAEIKNVTVGGVLGFGTRHACRDFGQLLDWMGEWEDWRHDEDRAGEHVKGHEHHHHERE